MNLRLIFVTILSISCASILYAQSEATKLAAPTAPVKSVAPPKEMFAFFEGDWQGKGEFKNGKALTSSYQFKTAMEGQVLTVQHEEHPPYTFKYQALWSIDAVSGNVIMLSATNRNGGGRLFRSAKGWEDQKKIVFQGTPELRATFALEKFTFQVISPESFSAIYEFSRDGLTWNVGDSQVFTKVAAK